MRDREGPHLGEWLGPRSSAAASSTRQGRCRRLPHGSRVLILDEATAQVDTIGDSDLARMLDGPRHHHDHHRAPPPPPSAAPTTSPSSRTERWSNKAPGTPSPPPAEPCPGSSPTALEHPEPDRGRAPWFTSVRIPRPAERRARRRHDVRRPRARPGVRRRGCGLRTGRLDRFCRPLHPLRQGLRRPLRRPDRDDRRGRGADLHSGRGGVRLPRRRSAVRPAADDGVLLRHGGRDVRARGERDGATPKRSPSGPCRVCRCRRG